MTIRTYKKNIELWEYQIRELEKIRILVGTDKLKDLSDVIGYLIREWELKEMETKEVDV